MMTVQGDNPDDGAIKFVVKADTRPVTPISPVNEVVIVYIIDSTGVGSKVIQTGDHTARLRAGDLSAGGLHRYTDSAVITLAAAGK